MAFKDFTQIFVVLCIIYSCNAQLTFHNDALSNSFTLKTPGLQQSFTRYFGGKQRANLLQAASAPVPIQQQPQQYRTQYQPQVQTQYQPQIQTQYQPQAQTQYQPQAQTQYQPQYRAQYQTQYQPQAQAQYQQQQYQTQFQPQYQTQYQPQYQQPQFLKFSSSSQYNQPAQQSYPYEAAYEQPLPQSSPFQGAYPFQTSQFAGSSAYRGVDYPVQAQTAQPAIPSYAEQMQQGLESYQQEQQQMQQMLQQQQYNQQQLLMDLYKTPQGQGRAVTSSPGRSQPFYTADQYINFLNKQHQDVFHQQQNVTDRGYSFAPMSAYTNGVPATATPMSSTMNYSPSTNSSRVNYTNGKLSYEF